MSAMVDSLPQEVREYYEKLASQIFSAVDKLLKGGKFDPVSLETEHETIEAGFHPEVLKDIVVNELEKRGMEYKVIETPWYADLWYEIIYPVSEGKEAHVKIYYSSWYNVHKIVVFLKVRT